MSKPITENYKGHVIELTSAYHPQVQNISIDGKDAGYCCFPSSGFMTAREIIDRREINAEHSNFPNPLPPRYRG